AAPEACVHCPTVESAPPRPPSATYRLPSGPNASPRGLLKPVAKTETFAGPFFFGPGGLCFPTADPVEISATSAAVNDAAVKSRLIRFLPLVTRTGGPYKGVRAESVCRAGILPPHYESSIGRNGFRAVDSRGE